MKTGRRGVEPTKKGEDPKKPKAQSEVKVTAKKQYNWEDVAKNEEVKARNKAASEKYQSDTEAYNKAMKLYNEGVDYSKLEKPKDAVALPSSKVRNKQATFNYYEGVSSAKSTNTELEKKIKSGEYVSLNDPSIDPTTRKLILGTRLGRTGAQSDILGKTTGEMYIPKGTKFKDYKEIYGEDFNPEEWEKAAKSGKFDEYSKKKGYGGKSFMAETGLIEKYQAPVQPQEPYYEKEENINVNRIPIGKLPVKQAKLAKGELATGKATSAPIEKGDWEGPAGGVRTKSRYVKPYNVKTGEYIGQNIKYAAQKAVGKQPILRPGVKKTREALIQGKTGREEQMAKAYFGGGFENQPMSTIRERQDVLKAGKAETKAGIKEARKAGDREKVGAYKAVKKDYNAEIKQAKLAGKYLEKYDRTLTGVTTNSDVNKYGGKIKTFTGQAMAGFEGSRQDTFNPNANSDKYIRKSTDNAANKNTITNQEKSLSFKEKVQASKQNRQNAPSFSERRKQRIADTKLQKSIKIPGQ